MQSMMKWPLIAAAILVVARVVLEQIGAPESVNNVFGVTWLYFLVPIYFAWTIAARAEPQPYRTVFKNLLLFATATRLMIMPTYWLAYLLNWSAPRFQLEEGGVVGEGITAFWLLFIPVRNAIFGIVFGTVVGMIISSVFLAVRLRGAARSQA